MSILPLQQIFYGAPGTGKSHIVEEAIKLDPHIRTTFHPDSDYSSFVGVYKPTMSNVSPKFQLILSDEELASKLRSYYNDKKTKKTVGLQRFCLEFFPYFDGEEKSVHTKKYWNLQGCLPVIMLRSTNT